MAIDGLAEALASNVDVFATDDDPELIEAAMPFALKTVEAFIAESPENPGLLLTACRGFTQYSSAFVESEADLVEWEDYEEASRLRERALRLYLRARDYGLRGLESERPGIRQELQIRPREAAAAFGSADVELVFWTAAAWGSAIALGIDRPALLADVEAVWAMLDRVLALDEGYGQGAIHEALITLECLPGMMNASPDSVQLHFERALELTDGKSAGPYLVLAESVCVGQQDRERFRQLLRQALQIDPDAAPELRLSNILAQRRARHLLETSDELFLEAID